VRRGEVHLELRTLRHGEGLGARLHLGQGVRKHWAWSSASKLQEILFQRFDWLQPNSVHRERTSRVVFIEHCS